MLKNTAFKELIVSAGSGNAEVLLELSDRYQKGIGGAEQNENKAYEYALKSFSAGNFDALARIADYYAKGKGGLKKNYEHAKELLAEGEKEKSVRCYQRLAHYYKTGECGFEKDEVKAIDYCTKIIASETEDNNVLGYAYTCVGAIYEDGKLGAPKNLKKALTFYQKAAKGGYAFAYVLLGNQKRRLYLQGTSSLSTFADTRTPDAKQKCKQRADELMEDIRDAQILYRQAIELAEQDADIPVIEGAKSYLEQTENDTRSLITFEKRLKLIDSENYEEMPTGMNKGYTLTFTGATPAPAVGSLIRNPLAGNTDAYDKMVASSDAFDAEVDGTDRYEKGLPSSGRKARLWVRVFGFALFCAAVGVLVAFVLAKIML